MTIYSDYQKLKSENPKMRMVDAAKQLKITEAELLNACVGKSTVRLNNDFAALLKSLKRLGKVMALARNEYVVTEISGEYEKVYVKKEGEKLRGMALNPGGIDLRFFFEHWGSCFATTVGSLKSIQFFDKYGVAIQKIYVNTPEGNSAYQEIIADFKLDGDAPLNIETPPSPLQDLQQDSSINVEELETAWASMTDVHQFPALLTAHNVGRHQAMRLVSDKWSKEVDPGCLETLLQQTKDAKEEIMAFVGNRGIVQIFSGTVSHLKPMGDWFNVLDPDFNLHVNTLGLNTAYIVHKPTDEGDVTVSSVEFLNEHGETVLTFFGRRSEGKVQTQGWKNIITQLISENCIAA